MSTRAADRCCGQKEASRPRRNQWHTFWNAGDEPAQLRDPADPDRLHAALRDWWREESPTRRRRSAALAFALIFVFATNGRLNFANSGAGNAELLRPEAMSPRSYELLDEVQTWARQEPNATIAVGEALRPSLLWHLRNVPTAQFQARPSER